MANSTEERTRYSETELAEFEEIINKKLAATYNEVNFIKETLSRKTIMELIIQLLVRKLWKTERMLEKRTTESICGKITKICISARSSFDKVEKRNLWNL